MVLAAEKGKRCEPCPVNGLLQDVNGEWHALEFETFELQHVIEARTIRFGHGQLCHGRIEHIGLADGMYILWLRNRCSHWAGMKAALRDKRVVLERSTRGHNRLQEVG